MRRIVPLLLLALGLVVLPACDSTSEQEPLACTLQIPASALVISTGMTMNQPISSGRSHVMIAPIAGTGSMKKVIGTRSATAMVAVRPGRAPTTRPNTDERRSTGITSSDVVDTALSYRILKANAILRAGLGMAGRSASGSSAR